MRRLFSVFTDPASPAMVLSLGILIASASQAGETKAAKEHPRSDRGFSVKTGMPITDWSYAAHVKGQEIQVFVAVMALREMNHAGAPQPTDLELHFPIAEDPRSGHAGFCKTAFERVETDEHSLPPGLQGLPVLQINIDLDYPIIQTDEGDSLYSDSAVNCWESVDSPPN